MTIPWTNLGSFGKPAAYYCFDYYFHRLAELPAAQAVPLTPTAAISRATLVSPGKS